LEEGMLHLVDHVGGHREGSHLTSGIRRDDLEAVAVHRRHEAVTAGWRHSTHGAALEDLAHVEGDSRRDSAADRVRGEDSAVAGPTREHDLSPAGHRLDERLGAHLANNSLASID